MDHPVELGVHSWLCAQRSLYGVPRDQIRVSYVLPRLFLPLTYLTGLQQELWVPIPTAPDFGPFCYAL